MKGENQMLTSLISDFSMVRIFDKWVSARTSQSRFRRNKVRQAPVEMALTQPIFVSNRKCAFHKFPLDCTLQISSYSNHHDLLNFKNSSKQEKQCIEHKIGKMINDLNNFVLVKEETLNNIINIATCKQLYLIIAKLIKLTKEATTPYERTHLAAAIACIARAKAGSKILHMPIHSLFHLLQNDTPAALPLHNTIEDARTRAIDDSNYLSTLPLSGDTIIDDIIATLISWGQNASAPDERKTIVLTTAAIASNLEGIRALLKYDDFINNLKIWTLEASTSGERQMISLVMANIIKTKEKLVFSIHFKSCCIDILMNLVHHIATSEAPNSMERTNTLFALANLSRIDTVKDVFFERGILDTLIQITNHITTPNERTNIAKLIYHIMSSPIIITNFFNPFNPHSANNILITLHKLAIDSTTELERIYITGAMSSITSIALGKRIFLRNNGLTTLIFLANKSSTPVERTNITKIIRNIAHAQNLIMALLDTDHIVKILIQLAKLAETSDELTNIVDTIIHLSKNPKGKKMVIRNNGLKTLNYLARKNPTAYHKVLINHAKNCLQNNSCWPICFRIS